MTEIRISDVTGCGTCLCETASVRGPSLPLGVAPVPFLHLTFQVSASCNVTTEHSLVTASCAGAHILPCAGASMSLKTKEALAYRPRC